MSDELWVRLSVSKTRRLDKFSRRRQIGEEAV